MKDDVVERIARALCVAQGRPATDNEMARATDEAQAALKAIEDAGLVIVPREPTDAMLDAGFAILTDKEITREDGSVHIVDGDEEAVYTAMISAATIGE